MAAKKEIAARPDGVPEGFGWQSVTVGDAEYVVRELSVDEIDDADEGAQGADGKVNERLRSRLLLSKALSPAVDPGDIGAWPTTKYVALLAAYNKLNSITLPN